MKSKFNSMWRVGIALVMVLSLGLVMAAPVSAAEGAALTVTITQPVTGSEIGVGGDFTITAEVENTGDVKATEVTATIDITVGATTADDLTKTVAAEIPVGDSAEVFWAVTCNAEGAVTIEVTPAGKDFVTGSPIPEVDLIPDTVAIQQVELVPVLTVDIIEPADVSNVSVGQEFTVTAVVINTGFATTTGDATEADIAISGSASITGGADPQTINDLGIGESDEATWTVICDAVGAVTIEVTPAGEYGAATLIPEANLTSDSIGLTQQLPAALEVTAVTAPANVKVGEEFDVTATVENTGEATATDVTATVTPGTTLDVTDETIGTGNAAETVFALTLDSPPVVAGTLVITDPVIDYTLSDMDWEKGTGTVTFVSAPPAAAILADYTGWETGAQAEVVGDADFALDIMAADEVKEATFTILCLAVGDAFIKVELAGNDANTESSIGADNLQPKSAVVIQKEAAVLEVNITAPADASEYGVGDEITVTATVENTGAATAQDVALTLSVDANAALAEGEVATQTVGYLAPAGTSSVITWTLICTAAGTSTITVSPSGIDVLTGAAIPAGSLIDAEVTVLQSVTTASITLATGWNLISLPLIPTDPDIDTVLADLIDADTVSEVRTFASDLSEKWWIPGVTASTLSQVVDGQGYWIEVSAGDPLIATGVDFALPGGLPRTYDVVVGWNLIGYTGTASPTILTYLGPAVFETLEAIYEYSAGAYAIPTNFAVGKGYWLAVNAAGKIYP